MLIKHPNRADTQRAIPPWIVKTLNLTVFNSNRGSGLCTLTPGGGVALARDLLRWYWLL